MMANAPRAGCGACGKDLKPAEGQSGRPRDYCDGKCRRRAQRYRDKKRRRAAVKRTGRSPLSLSIAATIPTVAGHLAAATERQAPLQVLLQHAARLNHEVGCYVAAAVQDERERGTPWSEIADAAGVREASARARWTRAKLQHLLGERSGSHSFLEAQPAEPSDTVHYALEPRAVAGTCRLPMSALGTALSSLLHRQDLSLTDLASEAERTSDDVEAMLMGRRLPTWPVTRMITEILGGDVFAVQTLWKAAHGLPWAPPASTAEADERLHHALRGLHLGVGAPTAAAISRRCGFDTHVVEGLLDSEQITSWTQLAALTSAMAVDPACIQPYWADLQRMHDREDASDVLSPDGSGGSCA